MPIHVEIAEPVELGAFVPLRSSAEDRYDHIGDYASANQFMHNCAGDVGRYLDNYVDLNQLNGAEDGFGIDLATFFMQVAQVIQQSADDFVVRFILHTDDMPVLWMSILYGQNAHNVGKQPISVWAGLNSDLQRW